MSMFELYLIAMLPSLKPFFGFLFFIFICSWIVGVLFHSLENKKLSKKFHSLCLTLVVTFGLGASLIPSHEQLAFIVGAEWATNNEDLREVPDNVAKVINGYLEELGSEIGEK